MADFLVLSNTALFAFLIKFFLLKKDPDEEAEYDYDRNFFSCGN